MKLELGTGNRPTDGFVHADKFKHSPFIDVECDLEKIPWPWEDASVSHLLAIDTFEHLRPWVVSVQDWLDECWRILEHGGMLEMRLPAWDNPYSWRDPTHYRVFHEESFLYWCPGAPGTVWRDFGRYYFGKDYSKWWNWRQVTREFKDLRFVLQKPISS
jgi:SAM-dependent methyltransferase